MTAEIAILNRSAVALGADSAATVSSSSRSDPFHRERKVFKGANKVFALSRIHPVGVMIFGDANFMGVPWETIFKLYRDSLEDKCFSTLQDYADNFFLFLETHPHLFPETLQDEGVFHEMASNAISILQGVQKELEHIEKRTSSTPGKRVANKTLANIIQDTKKTLDKQPFLDGNDEDKQKQVQGKHAEAIDFIIDRAFPDYTISHTNKKKLHSILASTVTKCWFKEAPSGIVFAGFGEDEHFPSLYAYRSKGIFEGVCSKVIREKSNISSEPGQSSDIFPFAQTEMVKTFMNGLDPDFQPYIHQTLGRSLQIFVREARKIAGADVYNELKTLSESIEKNFSEDFSKFMHENHYNPMKSIVDVLPKDELAELAETLITMESLKKRITMPVESVGGPVDVAVISKGDGLIWIKRKHYFDVQYNHHYLERVRRATN